MKSEKLREVIEYAVQNEVEAFDFYKGAAARVKDINLQSIFLELAEEELKHKAFLEEFLTTEAAEIVLNDFYSYKVSETVEKPAFSEEMTFVNAVALAMKNEEEAMNLYLNIAAKAGDEEQKKMFLGLAKMEEMHKAKLEDLYTNTAYAEVW